MNQDKLREALKPCRSPYCECEQGKCTNHGFYDARGEALAASKPEPQAGGLEVANGCRCEVCGEWQRCTPSGMTCSNGHVGAKGINTQLITPQSHREVMAEKEVGYRMWFRIAQEQGEALAKRDAALKACVEALEYFKKCSNTQYSIDLAGAAITQAQEARK